MPMVPTQTNYGWPINTKSKVLIDSRKSRELRKFTLIWYQTMPS